MVQRSLLTCENNTKPVMLSYLGLMIRFRPCEDLCQIPVHGLPHGID